MLKLKTIAKSVFSLSERQNLYAPSVRAFSDKLKDKESGEERVYFNKSD